LLSESIFQGAVADTDAEGIVEGVVVSEGIVADTEEIIDIVRPTQLP